MLLQAVVLSLLHFLAAAEIHFRSPSARSVWAVTGRKRAVTWIPHDMDTSGCHFWDMELHDEGAGVVYITRAVTGTDVIQHGGVFRYLLYVPTR